MILEHLPALNQHRLLLASASPRRKEILQNLGLRVEVVPSTFEENLEKASFKNGAAYAQATAIAKAQEVASRAWQLQSIPSLVIGADTVVEQEGCILEKPANASDAHRMLSRLSAKVHQVHTGVALVVPSISGQGHEGVQRSLAVTTSVDFAELSSSEIAAYIETGEPFGKAGAYGIQGPAGAWVRRIQGCYFNVMGFPVHAFAAEVASLMKEGVLKS